MTAVDQFCVAPSCRIEPAHGRVCTEHAMQLHRVILAIPALFDRLSPMPKLPSPDEVHQKPVFESKSPADDHAMMLADARSVGGPIWLMQRWQVAHWQVRTGISIEPDRDISRLVELLSVHWDYWRETDSAGEFYRDMSSIWQALAQSVGDIAPPAVIGICKCGTRLFRLQDVDLVVCSGCGAEYPEIAASAIAKAQSDYYFGSLPFWRDLRNRRTDF